MTALLIVAGALLTVAACAGWGRLVARCVGMPIDGGLALSWGLAVLLALGGFVTAVGVASAPVLLGIEACGVAALLLPPRPNRFRLDRGQAVVFAAAAVLLGLRLLASAQSSVLEPCDDFLAYQPLVRQLLQVGDLEAPFSLRRLAAYGGQTVLQAFAVPSGDLGATLLADAGLGAVFLFALGWSFLRRLGNPHPLPLAFSLLVGLGLILRVNMASQATSLVCFLALLRTIYLVMETDGRRIRLCVVLGLLAAAASSLRHLNLPFPALLMLAFLPEHATRRGWCVALRDGAVAAASWIAFLAPWMVALYASSRTPLYPLIKGFHNPGFDYASAAGGWRQVAQTLLGMLQVEQLLPILLLAPMAFFIRADRSLRLVQCAALAGAAAIVVSFPGVEPKAMARYIQPTLATAFFVTVLTALATGAVRSTAVRTAIAAAIALGVGRTALGDAKTVFAPEPPSMYLPERLTERLAAYAEVQELVPEGAPVFVYVSTPFAFDVRRNRILNADVPGPVSPPPGLPFFRGHEEVFAYLRGQGVRHVIFEDFETAVTWCIAPRGLDFLTDPMNEAWKPYFADIRANLRGLARMRRVLYSAHGVTLVDLAEPPIPGG